MPHKAADHELTGEWAMAGCPSSLVGSNKTSSVFFQKKKEEIEEVVLCPKCSHEYSLCEGKASTFIDVQR